MDPQDDLKALEGDYEQTTEELELVEEQLKDGEVKRMALTDELDELKEEILKLKVDKTKHLGLSPPLSSTFSSTLSSALHCHQHCHQHCNLHCHQHGPRTLI